MRTAILILACLALLQSCSSEPYRPNDGRYESVVLDERTLFQTNNENGAVRLYVISPARWNSAARHYSDIQCGPWQNAVGNDPAP